MNISIGEDRSIQIRKAYVGPVFVSALGHQIGICERDWGFELTVVMSDGRTKYYTLNIDTGEITEK